MLSNILRKYLNDDIHRIIYDYYYDFENKKKNLMSSLKSVIRFIEICKIKPTTHMLLNY
jgi:hypothetical protein